MTEPSDEPTDHVSSGDETVLAGTPVVVRRNAGLAAVIGAAAGQHRQGLGDRVGAGRGAGGEAERDGERGAVHLLVQRGVPAAASIR